MVFSPPCHAKPPLRVLSYGQANVKPGVSSVATPVSDRKFWLDVPRLPRYAGDPAERQAVLPCVGYTGSLVLVRIDRRDGLPSTGANCSKFLLLVLNNLLAADNRRHLGASPRPRFPPSGCVKSLTTTSSFLGAPAVLTRHALHVERELSERNWIY